MSSLDTYPEFLEESLSIIMDMAQEWGFKNKKTQRKYTQSIYDIVIASMNTIQHQNCTGIVLPLVEGMNTICDDLIMIKLEDDKISEANAVNLEGKIRNILNTYDKKRGKEPRFSDYDIVMKAYSEVFPEYVN